MWPRPLALARPYLRALLSSSLRPAVWVVQKRLHVAPAPRCKVLLLLPRAKSVPIFFIDTKR